METVVEWVDVGVCWYSSVLRKLPSVPNLLSDFYQQQMLEFVKIFFLHQLIVLFSSLFC